MLRKRWRISSSVEYFLTKNRWVSKSLENLHLTLRKAFQSHISCSCLESIKAIAALMADPQEGPFRLLIVDSIIGT